MLLDLLLGGGALVATPHRLHTATSVQGRRRVECARSTRIDRRVASEAKELPDEQRSPRCVLISYDEDEQAIQTCTVDRTLVTKLMQAALTIPWPLKDENFKLDNEFARRLGGVVFGLISVHQPELKQYINVTPHPDAIESHEPPAD